MPVIHIDTEQAALIEVAVAMLEGALTARTERVDPEQVISKALQLQAYKLETVRKLLLLPEPPRYSEMSETMQIMADKLMGQLLDTDPGPTKDALFERLRGVLVAPAFPASTPA
jgi:hypothetical protein